MTPEQKQIIFDRAVLGLASQEFRKSLLSPEVENGSEHCAYRSETCPGDKCAVGWCIDDDKFQPFDNWKSAFAVKHQVIASVGFATDELFLRELQVCHDAATSPENMQVRLRTFAARHELSLDTTFKALQT